MQSKNNLKIQGPLAKLDGDNLISDFTSITTDAIPQPDGRIDLKLNQTKVTLRTNVRVPRLGVMLVGLGGSKGTTLTAGILANKNKITWNTKDGLQKPNFFGSMTQSSVTKVGMQGSEEIFAPLRDVLPLVRPEDIVIGGWDINKGGLVEGMKRGRVIDWDLQQKLAPMVKDINLLPGICYKEFMGVSVTTNGGGEEEQQRPADNVIPGTEKGKHLEQIRQDIRNFRQNNKLDKVIVMWLPSTERPLTIVKGVHDTADNLIQAIKSSHPEVSPSLVYATAALLEGVSFINGSPQSILGEGLIQLASKQNTFIVGEGIKLGQNMLKSVLTDFLIGAGIKPRSLVSYTHLGTEEGRNLSMMESQMKPTETITLSPSSKGGNRRSNIEDIIRSNKVLFEENERVDDVNVTKFVPSAGDTKRVIEEVESDIFLGGRQNMVVFGTAQRSLLVAPVLLDLLLITEIMERITIKTEKSNDFTRFDPVLSILGLLTNLPTTASGEVTSVMQSIPITSSVVRQRNALENLFKVCAGVPVEDNMLLQLRRPVMQ